MQNLNERVIEIKSSEAEINRLLEEYKPFMASCIEKSTGKYIEFGVDDESSIALLAFTEAIRSYDITKGNFLSFARNVIQRRLIDHYRKEKKHANVVSIHEFKSSDEDEALDLTEFQAVENYTNANINELRKLELIELKKELALWDITFMDLADSAPKQEKTRKMMMEIVQLIKSRPDLCDVTLKKKYLPIAEIEKHTKIPRKTIERIRKYIIAYIIINQGDYQYVQSYVDGW